MEILLLLVERGGEIVTREEIVERVWGKGVFLDTDSGIRGAVHKIRLVLKDDPDQPRFIQTVSGQGYRFIAPVAVPSNEQAVETQGGPSPPGLQASAKEVAIARPSRRRLLMPTVFLVSVLVILGTSVLRSRFQPKPQSSSSRLMLAILPFQNLTGDSNQEYFSDGLTEEMITQLGNLDPTHVGVIARTSVMHYKNSAAALDQIGRELGVQYVLEGSVRRYSEKVRITAQLIQMKDQTHVWAREYDREEKDLLTVQAEIANDIADEIQLALGDKRDAPTARQIRPPASFEAYDLYLKGRYFWNKRTAEGFEQAANYFQQAIAVDHNYARAYAGLADTFGLMSTWYQVPQSEFMPKARAAALRALQLDETLAEAHASLALIAENHDYDWQTAEKEFRRAIQLDPGYATAHQWYAEYLSWQDRFDEALAESQLARQLDPLSLIVATDNGAVLYLARQYDRAIAQFAAVLEMEPTFYRARSLVISAYIQEGRFAEASAQLENWRRIDDGPMPWAHQAYVYGRWGRTAQAEDAFAKLEQLVKHSKSDPTPLLLLAYLGMNRKEEAIALLKKAHSEHSNAVVALKVEPNYDSLRGDPRFQELVRRVGFDK